jgi:glycosyl hydrolase family 59 (putative galactocerebrosidase)
MPHRPSLFRRVSLLVLGIVLGAAMNAQSETTSIDISQMQPGTAPRGFEFTLTGGGPVSAWKVVSDPTAAAQKAIAQTSQDRTDYRFPLAVYQPLSARNVEVTVRFKPVAGEVDQAGGIAVRLADRDNYYVVRANALEDNVRFYRVVNGRRQQIQGADVKVAPSQWHTLGLRAEGNRFTVSFDGKPLYTAEDKTFANAGKVALWTKADSVTHFDAISITPLD